MSVNFYNNRPVKKHAIIILLALLVSVLVPLTSQLSISPSDRTQHLVSLDVCSSPGSFISASADFPSVTECQFKPAVFESVGLIEGNIPHFSSSLFSLQIEQPPRV
jgi:hypothetical protein